LRFFLILLVLTGQLAFGQADTITIVSYNLLNFPEGRNDCSNNTVVTERYDTLRKILQYSNPDIFVACEIQTEAGADSVLTRSLNVFGASNYAAAQFDPNNLDQSLNNQLYYNTDKLTLLYQDVIETFPRSIDHYVLYANDPNLGTYFDTTFIEVYMCHLKAGSGTSNQNTRADQTQELMNFIAQRPFDRHHFVCGDLNIYNSSEPGYQNLVSGSVSVVDPINAPGNWNNNGTFSAIHTQSTRTSQNLDCGSSGGSDDRFDQILVSPNVMSGTDSLTYLTNSYRALGNDGNHFNSSLISAPTNTMYPDSVVLALYYMSDHLPVEMKVVISYPTSNGLALVPSSSPVSCYGESDGSAAITPMDGQAPYTYSWDANAGNQMTPTATGLSSGSYCVTVTDNLGEVDDYCVFVGSPDSLSYSIFKTPDSGACTGEAHVLVSGGIPPYIIEWNDPLSQSGSSAYNLCSGQYEVTITDDTGCLTIISVEIQGNDANIYEFNGYELMIYPNPTDGIITIEGIQKDQKLVLTDVFGKIMNPEIIRDTDKMMLNLEELPSGFYTLQIYMGATVSRYKLFKQ
jgi:hypothetical protein